jgi:hypothetical protein
MRGEGGGESAGLCDGFVILVGGEDLVAFAEKVDEIAAGAAAGVEDSHAGHDVAAKKLVEEVDVDRAELLVEGGHGFKRMIQDGGSSILMEDRQVKTRIRTDDTDAHIEGQAAEDLILKSSCSG